MKLPKSKPYYPLGTRLLIELLSEGALPQIIAADIDPDYGHVGRLTYADGNVRFFRNTNRGINNHGASAISKDKGYTRYFLKNLGYTIATGRTFLTDNYIKLIDTHLSHYDFDDYHSADDALTFIRETTGYPCFLKPNESSMGHGVRQCFDAANVLEVIASYHQKQIRVFLVEAAIPYPDYRVIVFDGQVHIAYQRIPLHVTGDGKHTIRDLLENAQETFRAQGRKTYIDPDDPRISKKLVQSNLTLEGILDDGDSIQIYDVANASTGGRIVDVTEKLHPHWKNLCANITHDMGLRLCGVDLACADASDPSAEYAIFEINSSPGMANYAASGESQRARVKMLMRAMF
ncbi:MAG: cyanophycin synthetase [Aggregatilineales bacterium]